MHKLTNISRHCKNKINEQIRKDYGQLQNRVLWQTNNAKLYDAVTTINLRLDRCQHVQEAFNLHLLINDSNSQQEVNEYCTRPDTRPFTALEEFAHIAEITFKKLIEGVNYDDNEYLLIAYDAYVRSRKCAVSVTIFSENTYFKIIFFKKCNNSLKQAITKTRIIKIKIIARKTD
jgi:hypothetical protein